MKNLQKHTKGQWQAHLQPEMDFRVGSYFPGQGATGLVATVTQNKSIDFEQAEANAKLIASAPELLHQLCIAVKHIKNIEEKYKPENPFAIAEYESAIKKATN